MACAVAVRPEGAPSAVLESLSRSPPATAYSMPGSGVANSRLIEYRFGMSPCFANTTRSPAALRTTMSSPVSITGVNVAFTACVVL